MELGRPLSVEGIGHDVVRLLVRLRLPKIQVVTPGGIGPHLVLHRILTDIEPLSTQSRVFFVADGRRHTFGHTQHGKAQSAHVSRHTGPFTVLEPLHSAVVGHANWKAGLATLLHGKGRRALDGLVKLLENLPIARALPKPVDHIHVAHAVERLLPVVFR